MSLLRERLLGRRTAVAAVLVFVGALPACDKLKSIASKGADGDAAASGGAAGGEPSSRILSFLGSDFEGEITMTMTGKAKPQGSGPERIVFGMKKPKYRLDIAAHKPDEASSVLFDLPTKKGYMLMHSKKLAMVLDFEKMKNMPQNIPGMPNAPSAPSQPPKIEKTGKSDVVAGYSCEIWNVTSEGKKAEVCAAEGITWIDIGDLGLTSPELTVAAVTTEANRFPLRVISYDANGKEEMRMEATKVEKKKLDDARFAVPPDYKVMDMPALMGGFMGIPSGIPTFKRPPR